MTTLAEYGLHIAGKDVPASGSKTYDTQNPYTGDPWAQVADGTAKDVDTAVKAAREAFESWGSATPPERAAVLRRAADLVEEEADRLARLESTDNGKLLRETSGQVAAIPAWFRYFAGVAETARGETIPTAKPNFFVYTLKEPVGVVGAIIPWNSPLLLLIWKLAPALAAGCTMVVKPSDHTPVSTIEFARVLERAGLPKGVLNVVTGWGPETPKALAAHPDVDLIAFTGSTHIGKEVAKTAADHLAETTLELGGKSAQVVFADAPLEAVRDGVIAGIFAATGQTCIAGSRLLVERSIKDELLDLLSERAETILMGDPLDMDSEMGPLANAQQLKTVKGYVEGAVSEGATVRTGGDDGGKGGLFYAPTIVDGATPEMAITNEEIFGPVLAVDVFDDEQEAIAKANATPFGLAAGVWTKDAGRAHRVAAKLAAGTVWVNSYRVVAPQVPFGGFGDSGWGRESGTESMAHYTRTKAVWIELEGQTRDPFRMG